MRTRLKAIPDVMILIMDDILMTSITQSSVTRIIISEKTLSEAYS